MRIIICDDNPQEQEQCVKLLGGILKKHNIPQTAVELYNSGTELLERWKSNETDVLFLDINMPQINGMEVAHILRERNYQGEIIFLTVSKRHVLEAFDVEAFNYLVKTELEKTKVESVLLDVYNSIKDKKRKYITLSRGGEVRNIPLDEIYYFEIKERIITVFYGEGETFSFYSTMEKVESALQEEEFVRIHRAYIVRVDKIKREGQGGEVDLIDGTKLPLGTKYEKKYLSVLKG